MDVILAMLLTGMLIGLIALAGYIWAVKSGQFDDLDEPAYQMMRDDDDWEGSTNG